MRHCMKTEELLRSLGALIRANRINAGLTQAALGDRAGIVGKYVSEIERGTRDVPMSTLLSIVEAGLQMQLDVGIRDKSEMSHQRALPVQLDAEIAKLPADVRAKVVTVVREVVELAR